MYYECCDLLIEELNERYDQESLNPLVAIERVIINSANGEECTLELQEVKESFISKESQVSTLFVQLWHRVTTTSQLLVKYAGYYAFILLCH